MRQSHLCILFLLSITLACNNSVNEEKTYVFRKANWGDTVQNILLSEGPLSASVYDQEDKGKDLEFEDTFLGVQTNLDNGIVARLAYHFEKDSLCAAWYYIYTTKDNFDSQAQIAELKRINGPENKTWTEEQNKTLYLWQLDTEVVLVLQRFDENKVRYEEYHYNPNWFKLNKHGFTIPD